LPRALLLGVLLWLGIVTFIMPYQGLGWGFRYLSGYLGSLALLAGFGYRWLAKQLGERADGMVLALSGLTAAAVVPMLIVSTHQFAEPYLRLDQFIDRQQTPFVLIDTAVTTPADGGWSQHPFNQVRNMPDLSNRPLRFSGNQIDAGLVATLCRKRPVTLITRADMHLMGFAMNVPERSPRFEALVRTAAQRAPGCFRRAMLPNVRRGR
jgi:hypothetical protein